MDCVINNLNRIKYIVKEEDYVVMKYSVNLYKIFSLLLDVHRFS